MNLNQHYKNWPVYLLERDQEASFQVISLPILKQIIDDTTRQIFPEDGGKYKTVMNSMAVSKMLKDNVISARGGIIHPRITMRGVTSRAICMEDPTATPIAKSILFLIATVTAVKCFFVRCLQQGRYFSSIA